MNNNRSKDWFNQAKDDGLFNKSSALNTDPVIIFPPKGKFNACNPDLIKEKIKIALQPKAKAAFFLVALQETMVIFIAISI